MYAVIETSGRQFKVSQGDTIEVDLRPEDPGTAINLDRVLLLSSEAGTRVGSPVVDGATVSAEVVDHFRGEKVTAFKMRRRTNYRRKVGFRAERSTLRITAING